MNFTIFLAAFAGVGFVAASPVHTGPAVNPVSAPLQPVPQISWEPVNSYKSWLDRKRFWEARCSEALTKEGCSVGIIHQGQITVAKPNNGKDYYVTVRGATSLDQLINNPKLMRVYQDGPHELVDRWTWQEKQTTAKAKRTKKLKGPQRQKEQQSLLFWDPPESYDYQSRRRLVLEKICDEALTSAGCGIGMIHKGETKVTRPNGQRTSYVNVEGAPLMDMENPKKLRVYQDASSEDFTKDGWTAADIFAMGKAKYPDARRKWLSPEQNSEGSKLSVSWDPPRAHENRPRLKKSYETACRHALLREGCDKGVMLGGFNYLANPDGTVSRYVTVSAGKKNDPGGMKYMRLFKNGSSEWYEREQVGGETGGELIPEVKNPYKRSREEEGTSWSTRARASTKASTGAAYPGGLRAPGRGGYKHPATHAPTQKSIKDVSKRRRVERGDIQQSDSATRPLTQASNPHLGRSSRVHSETDHRYSGPHPGQAQSLAHTEVRTTSSTTPSALPPTGGQNQDPATQASHQHISPTESIRPDSNPPWRLSWVGSEPHLDFN